MPENYTFYETVPARSHESDGLITQRSEIMQEIVSDRPGFLVEWGNYFFFALLSLLIAGTWFIRYPETIYAEAKLTSINAPKQVVAVAGGKLSNLSILENQVVSKGQVLGSIESTANPEAVLLLSSRLDSIQELLNNDKVDKIKMYFQGATFQLGELQSAYQILSQSFLSFDSYLTNGFHLKKRSILLMEKDNLRKLNNNLIEQKELQEQDLELIEKTFEANESLKKKEVISDFDLRIEKSKLINKKLSLPQIRFAIINNETLQAEKEKEIMEIDNAISQQKLIFQQALNTFRSQVDEWKRRYMLVAPISGKIAFSTFVQENQQLQPNQPICYINPETSQYFAEVMIPQSSFGKVKIGQLVLLKFQSYPFQEYGFVQGKIEFISHIPSNNGYLAKVGLENGLNTNHGMQIQYRDGLLATAEIITQDMRLMERFYYSIVRQ